MSNLTATLPSNGSVVNPLNGGLNTNGLNTCNLDDYNNNDSLDKLKNNDLNDADREMIDDDTPEVDINISNVVCNFSTRCHLNLRTIAMNGVNVEYRREHGVVCMKIRHPKVTASIWSSGKITVTGSTSEDEAKIAARKIARVLQKMSFKVKFSAYRVVNVLGSVILPFGIRIAQFTEQNRNTCSYEPEIHPGATYRFKEASATLKIFQTGAITITAPSVNAVQQAVEHIYPLVHSFKKDKPPQLNSLKRRVIKEDKIKSVHKSKKRRKHYADELFTDDLIDEEDEDLIDDIIDEEMSNDENNY